MLSSTVKKSKGFLRGLGQDLILLALVGLILIGAYKAAIFIWGLFVSIVITGIALLAFAGVVVLAIWLVANYIMPGEE